MDKGQPDADADGSLRDLQDSNTHTHRYGQAPQG